MDAQSNHSSERVFLPNLNVYLACVFAVGALFSSTEITALPRELFGYALLMMTRPLDEAGQLFLFRAMFWFYYGVFAVVLGFVWTTKGYLPEFDSPNVSAAIGSTICS
jgi:hypothetical protein